MFGAYYFQKEWSEKIVFWVSYPKNKFLTTNSLDVDWLMGGTTHSFTTSRWGGGLQMTMADYKLTIIWLPRLPKLSDWLSKVDCLTARLPTKLGYKLVIDSIDHKVELWLVTNGHMKYKVELAMDLLIEWLQFDWVQLGPTLGFDWTTSWVEHIHYKLVIESPWLPTNGHMNTSRAISWLLNDYNLIELQLFDHTHWVEWMQAHTKMTAWLWAPNYFTYLTQPNLTPNIKHQATIDPQICLIYKIEGVGTWICWPQVGYRWRGWVYTYNRSS